MNTLEELEKFDGYELVKTTYGYSSQGKYRLRVWICFPDANLPMGFIGWGETLEIALENVNKRVLEKIINNISFGDNLDFQIEPEDIFKNK